LGIYTIGNVGLGVWKDRVTNAIKVPFSKMDEFTLTLDGTLNTVNASSSMLPVWMIPADRKPSIEVKGAEIPLDGMSTFMGANFKQAATGTPIVSEWLQYATIGADGTVALEHPISATNLNVSIVGSGQAYTSAADTPTTGEYKTPAASDTAITFATEDAGKNVTIDYYFDTTTGVQIDYMPTSIPGEGRFVSTAMLLDGEGGPDVPCTFIVNRCQLNGNWEIDQQRMKASSTDLKMNILDPGGTNAAVSIIPTVPVLQ